MQTEFMNTMRAIETEEERVLERAEQLLEERRFEKVMRMTAARLRKLSHAVEKRNFTRWAKHLAKRVRREGRGLRAQFRHRSRKRRPRCRRRPNHFSHGDINGKADNHSAEYAGGDASERPAEPRREVRRQVRRRAREDAEHAQGDSVSRRARTIRKSPTSR
jgi:hypothetical protein